MNTNDLLQQALNELAKAAAELHVSAVQLKCAFSDEGGKGEHKASFEEHAAMLAAGKNTNPERNVYNDFGKDVQSEPVARASSKSDFIENASDKAFKETFVHPTMQEMSYRGHITINDHEKALIHALRDVNADEINEFRANLDHSGNWRSALNAFLAKRRVP